MSNVTFLLTFALIALKGSLGTSFGSPLGELEEIVNEFSKLNENVGSTISFINDQLIYPLREFDSKILSTVTKHHLFSTFDELEESVKQTESEVPEESKHCTEKAYRMVMLTSTELESSVKMCSSEVKTTVQSSINIAMDLSKKAGGLKARIFTDMWKCTDGNDLQCFKNLLDKLLQEHEDIKEEVDGVKDNILELTENGIERLNVDLNQIEDDLVLKSETILSALGQCIQANPVSFRLDRNIWDFIREIKEKFNHIIDILSDLPTNINQIPDKIQDIISSLNIVVITNQIKNEINSAISDGGRDAHKCRPEAEKRLDAIYDKAQQAAKICLTSADERVEAATNQIRALFNEAKTLLKEFNKQVLRCNFENILNPIALTKCIKSLYNEYTQKIADFYTQIFDLTHSIAEQSNAILEDVSKCVNKLQIDTVKEGQILIKDVEQCVLTAH